MKAVLFFLVFLSIPVFAVQIDQRWPTMSLGEYVDGECVAIPGVSKSIDDRYILEKAIEQGAGVYCVNRPDASVTIKGVIVPAPDEPPETEPETSPGTPEPPTDGSVNEHNGPIAPYETNQSGIMIPKSVDGPMDERFEALIKSPALIAERAFNSQEQITQSHRMLRIQRHEEGYPPRFIYDPAENAARLQMNKSGIGSSQQIRVYWPNLNHTNTAKVSLQWEQKWDQGFTSTPGMNNLKAFQISDPGEDLMFELQTRMHDAADVVAMPTIRYYRANQYGEQSDKDPMSSWGPHTSKVNGEPIDNWQPGGDTAIDYRDKPQSAADHLNPDKWSPYLILPDIWYRITFEFQYEDNELRFCAWMQNELESEPTLVIASVKSPGKCFLLSSNVNEFDLNFQNWWLEMNSSQSVFFSHTVTTWTKNLVVYKDASIPLE